MRLTPRLLAGLLFGSFLLAAAPAGQVPSPVDDFVPEVKPRPRPPAKNHPPPAPAGKEGKIVKAATPEDSVNLAFADLATVPFFDRFFIRYVWLLDGGEENVKASVITLNYVSRASVPYRPEFIAPFLLRVDLRGLARNERDLSEIIVVWEELRFDPKFSRNITKDVIDLLNIDKKKLPAVKKKGVRKEKWLDKDDKEFYKDVPYDYEESVADADNFQVLRLNGEHLDQVKLAQLQLSTLSQAPVVSQRYLESRLLTTIKVSVVNGVQNLFTVLYGGLYYDFRGIKKVKDVKGKNTPATDQDLFLENLGVGSIRGRVKQDQLFDRLRSDSRAVMYRSSVTGKWRLLEWLPTLATRDGISAVSITHDVKDESIDVGSQAFKNLLKFKDDAREVIATGTFGMHVFAMFNGEGALQDEVPPEVAADRTIPPPYTTRLQVISCIRCHGDSDGWKSVPNELPLILKGGNVQVVGDVADPDRPLFDLDDRVNGLYRASGLQKALMRGRDDYNEVLVRVAGPWKKSKDQTDLVRHSSDKIGADYASYWYTPVDAKAALLEVGVDVPAPLAVATFKVLFPPDPGGTFRRELFGVVFEDVTISALIAGKSVNRVDWDLVYSFAAERCRRSLAKLIPAGDRP